MPKPQHTTFGMSLLAALIAVLAFQSAIGSGLKRKMEVHRVTQLGLEIWTELEPTWETRLDAPGASRPVFRAETPNQFYPPAGMSWATAGVRFSAQEFRRAAEGAVAQAARNYGLDEGAIANVRLQSAKYGDLEGFEAQFPATVDSTPVEVKVFFGHQPGEPAVAMQAFTLRGKLPHISEHIRRSWTNTRYLLPSETSK